MRGVDVASVYLELYGRIPPLVRRAVAGVPLERLSERPTPEANPIAWLVWHIGRIQDDHIAALVDEPQLWVTGDWAPRFGLEPDPSNTGFGHTPEQVASVRPESPDALLAYFDAAYARTRSLLEGLTPEALDRVVDPRWNPPVTLGVRLVSVADDGLQHCGQAAYVKGLLGY